MQRTDLVFSEAATAVDLPCLVYGVCLTARSGNVSCSIYDHPSTAAAPLSARVLTLAAPANSSTTWTPPFPVELHTGCFASLSSGAIVSIALQRRT
jgi:hypothetical protein